MCLPQCARSNDLTKEQMVTDFFPVIILILTVHVCETTNPLPPCSHLLLLFCFKLMLVERCSIILSLPGSR